MGMTIEEFINVTNEQEEEEMKFRMYEERKTYHNNIYGDSVPDSAYVKVNDVLKIIDEVKLSLMDGRKYLDASGGLYFLDGLAMKITEEFYKNQ